MGKTNGSGGARKKGVARLFTDRESGTYGGLMLSLREYADRLEAHPGYQLNRKPRQIDCVIIDKKDGSEPMELSITKIFSKHNIIELKNPFEVMNIDTVWKVISYAAQYKSEGKTVNAIPVDDVTITMLRASRPRKVFKMMRDQGYRIDNAYPGIYYITGMSAFKMQVVVTGELEGKAYAPLKVQQRRIDQEDLEAFKEQIRTVFQPGERDYVEMVIKYGLYDEGKIFGQEENDMKMYDRWLEYFKDDFDKARAEGRAEGIAEGREQGMAEGRAESEAERKELAEEVARLKEELRKMKVAML